MPPVCNHRFTMFNLPRPRQCNNCGQQASCGAVFFGCKDCEWDICDKCTTAQKADSDIKHQPAVPVGGFEDEDSTDDEATGSWSLSLSVADTWATSSWGTTSILSRQDSNETMATANSFSNSRSMLGTGIEGFAAATGRDRGSLADGNGSIEGGARKECGRCGELYVGFGGVCAPCRRKGPAGAVHQCQGCDQFFKGFSKLCMECTAGSSFSSQLNAGNSCSSCCTWA